MRISDWSSDVCSSDLHAVAEAKGPPQRAGVPPAYRRGTGARPRRGCRDHGRERHRHHARLLRPAIDRWPGHVATAPLWDRPRLSCRSEEHTSELQSLMRISYAVFCLKKKTKTKHTP